MLKSFKGHGADKANGTMAAIAVAVNFNIFEYGLAHLFTGDKTLTVGGLHLQAQAVEETFIAGTATAVALAVYGTDNLLFCHKILMHSNSAGRRDLNAI